MTAHFRSCDSKPRPSFPQALARTYGCIYSTWRLSWTQPFCQFLAIGLAIIFSCHVKLSGTALALMSSSTNSRLASLVGDHTSPLARAPLFTIISAFIGVLYCNGMHALAASTHTVHVHSTAARYPRLRPAERSDSCLRLTVSASHIMEAPCSGAPSVGTASFNRSCGC